MSTHRRLSAIWFADVVDYSDLSARDEAGAMRLIEIFQQVARRAVEEYGGRVVKFLGDEALAEFPSTLSALAAADRLRSTFLERAERGRLGRPALRIGVHVGDVVVDPDGDLYGDGVNAAARIREMARPGEILASEDVRRQLRPRTELVFEPRGEPEMKGVGRIPLHAVRVTTALEPEKTEEGDVPRGAGGLLRELKRRHVLRVAGVYLLVAWVVVQVANATFSPLHLPAWALTLVVVMAIGGFPIAIVLAWAFELTPNGVRRTPVLRAERPVSKAPVVRWGRLALAAVVVFAISVAAVRWLRPDGSGPAPVPVDAAAPGIAILPFQVSGAGLEDMEEGMVDLLSTNLDGVAGYRAIESGNVIARWRRAVGEGGAGGSRQALAVAREVGARYAVVGSMVAVGRGIRVTAEIYDLETSQRIGRSRAEGVIDSVFGVVDRLTIELIGHIPGSAGGERPSLARVTTDSLEALKAYLAGEARFRRSDFAGAFEAFQRAVDIDSTFALALYRQGVAAGWGALGETTDYLERAARHGSRLPPRERSILAGTLAYERGSLDAIPILEQATRRYPEDAAAWFQLGEAYFHLGPQVLLSPASSERAFAHALEIDEALSPAYIHLIELSIGWHADSALARRWVSAFRRISPTSREARLHAIAFDLAFGDSPAREAALAALDTLQPGQIRYVARNHFWHPRLLALQAQILEAVEPMDRQTLTVLRIARGQLAGALSMLDEAGPSAGWRTVTLYRMSDWGLPVPEDRLDAALDPARLAAEHPDPVIAFCVGARAIDAGRDQDHRAASRALVEAGARARAAGDSMGVRFAEGAAQGLDGYARWREGHPEEAWEILVSARESATGFWPDPREEVNAVIRGWLGRLAAERGDWREAERHMASFWSHHDAFGPLARVERAAALDRLGRSAEARRQRAAFLTAWSEADPALRPWLERGRGPAGSAGN